jgi:ArsR family transcriptional regulator
VVVVGFQSAPDQERGLMQHVDAAGLAKCLKAVCDPNRIQILGILVEGEYCVSDLVRRLGIDQPKVSHHLAILRDAGVIRSRREGRHINYSIYPNVHRRLPTAGGLSDVFELGEISVTFRFTADPGAGTRPPAVAAPAPQARPEIAAPAQRSAVQGLAVPGSSGLGSDHREASGAGAAG